MASPEAMYFTMPHNVAHFLFFLVWAKQEVIEFYLVSFSTFSVFMRDTWPHTVQANFSMGEGLAKPLVKNIWFHF